MDVAILLFDGFDELDAIGPFEVFQKAAEEEAAIDVSLCTLKAAESVTASHGLRVEPDGQLGEGRWDLLLVPGGGWTERDGPGAWAEAERGEILDAIGAARDRGTTVAAVCTGGMLLARAGLLDGRPATTHQSARADMRTAGVEVVDERVVDLGDVLTAGGVTAGLDLALHVVEREVGPEIAELVRQRLEYDPQGSAYQPT